MSDRRLNEELVIDFIKLKKDGTLHHRESQILEFKESFNLAGLADYYRDFAAFANNKGGFLIFGVKDKPRRELIGLKKNAVAQFDKLDPETISGHLLEIFSSNIIWEHEIYSIGGLIYGVFHIFESENKPIICKKNEGKDQILKNGEIYYRYGGRTQKIQYAELDNMITHRVNLNNSQWMSLVQKIGKAGPQSTTILNVDKGLLDTNSNKQIMIDENLIKEIRFIKEGDFKKKKGEKTLKLVGNVVPIEKIEIVKKEIENKLKSYPLTAMELIDKIKSTQPEIKQNRIYEIIKENDLKNNILYSDYIFRSNRQQEDFESKGILPKGITSIYNQSAVDYIINIFKNEKN